MLTISLVTLGDPNRLSGGYLYHRRLAEAAPTHDARIRFVCFPDLAFPLPALVGPALLREAADVVLLDSIAAAYAAPWLLARHLGRPLVAIAHQTPGGLDHGPARTRVQAALDWAAYRRCRLVVLASEAIADHFLAGGIPKSRLLVVPPGRDLARTDASAGDLHLGRRTAFLFVGNWLPRKGLLETLEALARLPPHAATLHVAGDERADRTYARRVRSRLARPDLAGRVVLHGRLPQDALAALYAGADVFVMPSMREPYGTAYGEAMASGLPVVGWRAGNLPYLAEDGREGVLLRTGDVDGLANALGRLADDESLRRRMGEAARRRAASLPTWEESAARLFTALREVAH